MSLVELADFHRGLRMSVGGYLGPEVNVNGKDMVLKTKRNGHGNRNRKRKSDMRRTGKG